MCDTCRVGGPICYRAQCIIDFNGRGSDTLPTAVWADWCPSDKLVYFGGAWSSRVPPLPATSAPEDHVCEAHAQKFLPGRGIYDGPWPRN